MGLLKQRHCSACGNKHWTTADDIELELATANFCDSCLQGLRQHFDTRTQQERDFDAIYEGLNGFREVVINRSHGHFELSHAARTAYLDSLNKSYTVSPRESRDATVRLGSVIRVDGTFWEDTDLVRDDPVLVNVVRRLGVAASGPNATLKIVSIPADVDWDVNSYDGCEWVYELHRRWV